MNFIDPVNTDHFEKWLGEEEEKYVKNDQYQYSLVVKDILRKYRNFKENGIDAMKYCNDRK